jgi:hypothetical protein
VAHEHSSEAVHRGGRLGVGRPEYGHSGDLVRSFDKPLREPCFSNAGSAAKHDDAGSPRMQRGQQLTPQDVPIQIAVHKGDLAHSKQAEACVREAKSGR